MTTKQQENDHVSVHLPDEIILNILRRLPVKSLNRFRCVAKRWRSVISDPRFAESHFKLASEQETLSERHMVSLAFQLQSLDFEMPSFGDESSVRNLTFPISLSSNFKQVERIYLMGSCNGFVLLSLDHLDLYLWNPSTRFVRKIPNPKFDFWMDSTPVDISFGFYGLGYVSASDDYKLIVGQECDCWCAGGGVEEEWMGGGLDDEPAQMFSLRTNSWKSIKVPPRFICNRNNVGALTNEALHWAYCSGILAFDFAREEFREVTLPIFREGDDYDNSNNEDEDSSYHVEHRRNMGVQVLSGGCLCVSFCRRRCVEFWVMREYGVHESCTLLFKFRIADLPVSRSTLRDYKPVFITESGTVVLELDTFIDNQLIKIECLNEKMVRNGPYSLIKGRGKIGVVQYRETLLALPD